MIGEAEIQIVAFPEELVAQFGASIVKLPRSAKGVGGLLPRLSVAEIYTL